MLRYEHIVPRCVPDPEYMTFAHLLGGGCEDTLGEGSSPFVVQKMTTLTLIQKCKETLSFDRDWGGGLEVQKLPPRTLLVSEAVHIQLEDHDGRFSSERPTVVH